MRKNLLPAVLALILVPASVRAAAPPPAGANFQVNDNSEGWQLDVDAAQDTAGDTVYVWIDTDPTPNAVMARIYDAAGRPVTDGIVIATDSQGISHPRVAATPLGEFVVVWGGASSIFLRRYDRLGRPLGAAVATQQPLSGEIGAPDVAVDAAGNAAAVWSVSSFDGDTIFLQRFDRANHPQGAPMAVSQSIVNDRENARIAAGPGGSLLVSWDDHRVGGTTLSAFARRYDGPSGAWAAEVRVSPSGNRIQPGTVPVFYPVGDGAVLFTDLPSSDLMIRRIDATGLPAGDPVRIAQAVGSTDPWPLDAAAGPDGTTLVTWEGYDGLVRANFFNESFNALGTEFAPSSVAGDLELEPVAAAGGPGQFAVSWVSVGQPSVLFPELPSQATDGRDGSGAGVFAQRFQAAGCVAGGEVLCLDAGRFQVRVSWKNPYTGETGTGKAQPLTDDTGAFWFFDADNLELMLKVLDGRAINDHFWVFYGSLSNVEYTVTLTDTVTGAVKTYHNAPLQLASKADVEAFAAEPPPIVAARRKAAPLPVQPAAPAAVAEAEGSCVASPTGLCLAGQRFRVEVSFTDPRDGVTGTGQAVPLTGDTGVFWFFSADNLELMIKVLDGRTINDHFWVFYGALSDVSYKVTVTDTATGQVREYNNAAHELASVADTAAFPASSTN